MKICQRVVRRFVRQEAATQAAMAEATAETEELTAMEEAMAEMEDPKAGQVAEPMAAKTAEVGQMLVLRPTPKQGPLRRQTQGRNLRKTPELSAPQIDRNNQIQPMTPDPAQPLMRLHNQHQIRLDQIALAVLYLLEKINKFRRCLQTPRFS